MVLPSVSFRGHLFTFENPEAFVVTKFEVGKVKRWASTLFTKTPCAVLNDQSVTLPPSVRGQLYLMEVVNVVDETVARLTDFAAELHGTAFVDGEGSMPTPNEWEGPS